MLSRNVRGTRRSALKAAVVGRLGDFADIGSDRSRRRRPFDKEIFVLPLLDLFRRAWGHRGNSRSAARYDEIYVLAPSRSVSGGPEALHQLVDALRRRGHKAYISYVPKAASPIPDAFAGYDVVARKPRDRRGNLIVVPEIWTNRVRSIGAAEVAVWWLSVDNFFGDRPDDDRQFAEMVRRHEESASERDSRKTATWRELRQVRNLHQSRYAARFLETRGIASEKLGDYINEEFGEAHRVDLRRDALAYNPAKGLPRVQHLMALFPRWNWIPIQGLTRREVGRLLAEVKIYVDFGSHPGRDRLPREAALAGACVITGTRGSAGVREDMPIPDIYRIDDNVPDHQKRFGDLVSSIFGQFDIHTTRFDAYREKIRGERSEFERDVTRLFE